MNNTKALEEVRIGTYRDDEDSAIYSLHSKDSVRSSVYQEDFKKIKKIVVDNKIDMDVVKRILILRDRGCSENEIRSELAEIFSKEKVKYLITKVKYENIFSITPSNEIYINIENKKSNISFISFSFTKPLAIITDKEKNIHAQINTNPFYTPTLSKYLYSDLVGSTLYVYLYASISKFLHEKCIIEVDYLTEGCDPSNIIKQLEQLDAEKIHIIKKETGDYAVKCKIRKKIILSFMGFREISPNEYSMLVNHEGEMPAWLVRNELPLEKDDYLLQDVLFKKNNKIIINGVSILNNGTRDIANGIYFVTQKAHIQKHIIKGIIRWAEESKIGKCIVRSFTYHGEYKLREHKRESIELK